MSGGEETIGAGSGATGIERKIAGKGWRFLAEIEANLGILSGYCRLCGFPVVAVGQALVDCIIQSMEVFAHVV